MNTDCPTCFEPVLENPLICKHKVHMNCLQQQFKAECPLCRHKLNIKLFSNIKKDEEDNKEDSGGGDGPSDRDLELEHISDDDLITEDQDEDNYKTKGYLYKEEASDYDEENPDGDEVDY